MPQSVRANRAFLARVARFLAGEAGIRQFLDIGTGIPSADNTHEVAQTLDFGQPVAIMLIAIMYCIPDEDDPYGIAARLVDALPPGSFLALSHPARDLNAQTRAQMSTRVNAMLKTPVTLRDRAQVARFFDGVELIDPGVVVVPEWRPVSELEARSPAWVWGGVGRKR